MPHVDGFEFITRIRASANSDIRDIPAAALTAFARSDDRTKALESGFEMHLAKPVDPGELVASVGSRADERPLGDGRLELRARIGSSAQNDMAHAGNGMAHADVTNGGVMNRDELEGKAEALKGKIKQGVGNLTGDDELKG